MKKTIERERMNIYVAPSVKKRLEEYAEDNFMSLSACSNMIFKNYLDGVDLLDKSGEMNSIISSLVSTYNQLNSSDNVTD